MLYLLSNIPLRDFYLQWFMQLSHTSMGEPEILGGEGGVGINNK